MRRQPAPIPRRHIPNSDYLDDEITPAPVDVLAFEAHRRRVTDIELSLGRFATQLTEVARRLDGLESQKTELITLQKESALQLQSLGRLEQLLAKLESERAADIRDIRIARENDGARTRNILQIVIGGLAFLASGISILVNVLR